MYESVDQVFSEGFPSRFSADDSENEKVCYLFCITDTGFWRVEIANKEMSISKEESVPPSDAQPADVEVVVSQQDFLDLANEKESLQMLFMTGRLALEGDLVTALKLVQFFPKEK